MSPESSLSRRGFLVGAGTAGLAGAASTGASAQEGTTHTVDMTDDLVFDPDELTIAPGDTVVWENVGQIGHTVTAYEDEIPAEAEFFASGDATSESEARGAYPPGGDVAGGDSYEHTFEAEGEYGYFCIPHEGVGMVATLSVVPGGAQPEGPAEPAIPESALALGVGAAVALVSVLALTYAFLKYGGGGGAE